MQGLGLDFFSFQPFSEKSDHSYKTQNWLEAGLCLISLLHSVSSFFAGDLNSGGSFFACFFGVLHGDLAALGNSLPCVLSPFRSGLGGILAAFFDSLTCVFGSLY